MANHWFPKIEASDVAYKLAKQGAIGVLVFAFMNAFGAVFVYYSRTSPVDQQTIDSQGVQDHVLGALILVPLLLVFAYRIYKGKGWLVAALVLAWFMVEVGLKIAGGSTNVGWIIAYVAVAAMMFNGIRGCWWLRKAEPQVMEG